MVHRKPCAKVTKKLLVSACLLGEPVRYDGQSKPLVSQALETLQKQNRIIPFCPEVAGGLSTPRQPAEIQFGGDCVKTATGEDITEAFQAGARQAVEICQQHDIHVAILTELSPSCGSSQIYDGSFGRRLIEGMGITTALLRAHGVRVFNQFQIEEAGGDC
ncbi:MAG: DUF523 domain-containing protein [Gammaproteobacteria bacterium]|nr:DUF523 domain-containing protein [Gammaproteobacteria bacterium]